MVAERSVRGRPIERSQEGSRAFGDERAATLNRGRRRGAIERAATLNRGRHRDAIQRHADRRVLVRAEHRRAGAEQSPEGGRRRVAVAVVCPDGHRRNLRPKGVELLLRRRRPAPVMGDLEQIDRRQTASDEHRVDALLDVAGQEEPQGAVLAEHDDRDIVHARACVRWASRYRVCVGPQDAQAHAVDLEPVARPRDARFDPVGAQPCDPRLVARTRPGQSGVEHPADAIALEQARQAGNMVLVRVSEHDEVDPTIPRGDVLVELEDQTIGVGSAVDEHPRTAIALDEDRVSLAHVEDRHDHAAVGPRGGDQRHGHDRGRDGDADDPPYPRDAPQANRCASSPARWRRHVMSGA